MKHLVILGNGIAGVTTARNVRKRSDMKITIISAESDHFYSRTALMYIFMGHMTYENTKPYEDWFWGKNNIIRASCVGCGVCAAVCPRGVLSLENGPTEGRFNLVD